MSYPTRLMLAQLLLIFGFTAVCFGQVDPTKALVGVWEGQVEISRNMERTLVITTVTPTGTGEWLARGRFGLARQIDAEKGGGGREMTVVSKDNEIHLEVADAGKAPARLKLVGENRLEGTIELFEKGRMAPRRITLEKVKAGDTK